MGTLNCAANGFTEMELGRETRTGRHIGQILKYWYRIMCLNMEKPIKQCYQWQKSKVSVRSWMMEFTDELYNTGAAFMWRKQQQCNLTKIKIVKDR
jgi:hypothetical protein